MSTKNEEDWDTTVEWMDENGSLQKATKNNYELCTFYQSVTATKLHNSTTKPKVDAALAELKTAEPAVIESVGSDMAGLRGKASGTEMLKLDREFASCMDTLVTKLKADMQAAAEGGGESPADVATRLDNSVVCCKNGLQKNALHMNKQAHQQCQQSIKDIESLKSGFKKSLSHEVVATEMRKMCDLAVSEGWQAEFTEAKLSDLEESLGIPRYDSEPRLT